MEVLRRGKKSNKSKWRVADMFCGCGGLSLGWSIAGVSRPVLAVDSSRAALETYQENFDETTVVLADLSSQKQRDQVVALARELGVNVVVGGPPCQGFSGLNNHSSTRKYQNLNTMPLRFVDMASAIGAEIVMMEEVVAFKGTAVATEVQRRLQQRGYTADSAVLNAEDYGVPQSRHRFILVGAKRAARLAHFPPAPRRAAPMTVRQALALKPRPERGIPISESSLRWVRLRERGLLKTIKPTWHVRSYSLMDWDRPAPTLTTSMSSAGSGRFTLRRGDQYNRLSVEEAKRLQGFPDRFRFPRHALLSSMYRQLGNSVPPPLGKAVATALTR